jgi:hypothetical protein
VSPATSRLVAAASKVAGSVRYDQSATVNTPSSAMFVFLVRVETTISPPATRMRVAIEGNARSATAAPVAGSILKNRASLPLIVPSVRANSQDPSVASSTIGSASVEGTTEVHGSTAEVPRSIDARPARSTPPLPLKLPPTTTPSGADAAVRIPPTTSGTNGIVAAVATSKASSDAAKAATIAGPTRDSATSGVPPGPGAAGNQPTAPPSAATAASEVRPVDVRNRPPMYKRP